MALSAASAIFNVSCNSPAAGVWARVRFHPVSFAIAAISSSAVAAS